MYPLSAPRGGGFAFDEDSHPYYIDYEARAPLPFPDDGKGGFLFAPGTAYAVWTGIGAVGAAVLGMFLFGESHAPMRIVSILLVVAGIAGLRFTAS
jgi:hypothetical protein